MWSYKGYFKSFASVIRSSEEINKWTLKQKKNFIFLITLKVLRCWSILFKKSTNGAQTKKALFSSLLPTFQHNYLSDSYSIPPSVLLVDRIPLWGSLLVLTCPALNLCTHRFTVDFVIIFYIVHYAHSRVNFNSWNNF